MDLTTNLINEINYYVITDKRLYYIALLSEIE